MNVRAYNLWASMLNGRHFPSITDVDPGSIDDFGSHGVLFDLSHDPEDPKILFLGSALREECGVDRTIAKVSDVPARSLLSRLTDHYLQTVANRAPIGFEAEFINRRGLYTLYRGILMPLSESGQTIDAILGVINWKELGDSAASDGARGGAHRAIAAAISAAAATPSPAEPVPADADCALADSLADRLSVARDWADQACNSDQRSRAALYRALAEAYDFALAAEADPETYAELLADAGIKVQARAPMTPVVKLVFGAAYDKTRLTEFATALTWARQRDLPQGALAGAIEGFAGGLKGIVQSERSVRRASPQPDPIAAIVDRMRTAPAFVRIAAEIETEEEFVLLVARREKGCLAILSPVTDGRVLAQAIRKSPSAPPLQAVARPEPAAATVVDLPARPPNVRSAPAASLSRFRPRYSASLS